MAICSALSASSFCYSSPIVLADCARNISKIKTFKISCSSTTDDRIWKWNLSRDVGPTLKESFKAEEYENKKEEIKVLLLQQAISDDDHNINRKDGLVLVDAIQRIGTEHLFYEEIKLILGQQYKNSNSYYRTNQDLYNVSLYFRLLRQQGYDVSSDVFNSFKSNNGKFREELKGDVRGLMEMYEASQLSFRGEETLYDAEKFSRLNLNICMENMGENWCKKLIKNTLLHPQHKNIPRLAARRSLVGDHIRGCKGWETLTELANMDFVMGESLHQEEVLQVSKWWKSLGLSDELQRVRDQPVKWYLWAMAVLIDYPSLSLQRTEFTKVVAFIYLIDDIFDLYGTLDELAIFTQAVNRWDYAAIHTLPDYMRNSYKALLDTTNEIAREIEKSHGHNPISSLQETWANLCNAFLVESRWYASNELPPAKEYLKNGEMSSGVHLILGHLFFLLGLGGGDTIQLNDTTNLISSVATILRLHDDLGSAEDEKQDGEDGSYVKCYMNDKPHISMDQARQHVMNMISNEWRNINKECFHLNHSSASCFKRGCLNLARMVPLMYTYDENKRLPLLQECVKTTAFFG